MNPANPLKSIFYIKLPEDFKLSNSNSVHIDPKILLPVQKKDGDTSDSFNVETLAPEQILSGLLTVLAYEPQNQNAPYYRKLLEEARPGIKKELAEAAILKAKNEDWDLAEEIWLALRGLYPNDSTITLNMALLFDQKADSYRRSGLTEDADAYDESAYRYYTEAMDSEPPLPDAYFNAAFFHLKRREFGDAKEDFENYLALTADFSDEELGENGIYKKERAQEMINKITNRNLEDSHFHDAYMLISSGQEEKGLEEIQKFIRDNPAVWNAWFLLGWGLRRLNKFEEAKQAFLKAKECDGGDENADTLNELAICQIETGDFKGAKESLVDALNLDPDNTKIISNMGFLALREGDTEEALRYFQTVNEIEPSDKIAQEQIKELKALLGLN